MDAEYSCPYCGEPISLWLDETGGTSQHYIEDCSICCRPITIQVHVDENGEPTATLQRDDD